MLSGPEILSTAQMRAIESAAMNSGETTGLALMARAGAAVAGQIRLRWPRPGRVVVLCGPGNNGGDGYVIARLLQRARWQVRVLGLPGEPGPDAAEMRRRWRQIGPVGHLSPAELPAPQADWLWVDAIFGTGLARPLEGEIAAVLARLARPGDGRAPDIIAVDCPSGLCMDSGRVLGDPAPAVPPARLTVAFDSAKPGHLLARGAELCGRVVIADIGLAAWRAAAARHGAAEMPRAVALLPTVIGAQGMLAAALAKPAQGHKYASGHALILAGGPGRGGAARLAARAALRAGTGLVTLAPTEAAMAEHAGAPDALMRRPVADAAALRATLADPRISAVAVGPGCGVDRAAALLEALLADGRACVLDADALTALAGAPDLARRLHRGCVLTPHAGEFARLFPDLARRLSQPPLRGPAFSRLDAARAAAAASSAVVLLKGPDTVIAAPDGRAGLHSAFDLPWLATAGSGDVLAGLIAGLLARGLAPADAAAAATLLHAAAARRIGPGLIADDLPEQLPGVLRDIGV